MGADEFYFHLYHTGEVIPGGNIDIKAAGLPSAPVMLALGAGIKDPPISTLYGDLYIAFPILQFNIGAIPSNGILVFPATVPTFWNPLEKKPLQALFGQVGNQNFVLSNLMVLAVKK